MDLQAILITSIGCFLLAHILASVEPHRPGRIILAAIVVGVAYGTLAGFYQGAYCAYSAVGSSFVGASLAYYSKYNLLDMVVDSKSGEFFNQKMFGKESIT